MFKSAGIEDKSNISHVDFTGLLKEFNMDFLSVGLDFKGARQNFLDTSTNTSKMSTFAMDALTDQKGISRLCLFFTNSIFSSSSMDCPKMGDSSCVS